MEILQKDIIINNFNSKIILDLSKHAWFNILSYLDLKSFLNLEKSSKLFRKIFINYYSDKNTIEQEKENLKNKTNFIIKNNISNKILKFPTLLSKDIKIYKKNIIEKYYNFLIQIPYTLAEFCGIYSNKTLTDLINNKIIKINDFNFDINESLSCNSSLDYYNNGLPQNQSDEKRRVENLAEQRRHRCFRGIGYPGRQIPDRMSAVCPAHDRADGQKYVRFYR